MNPPAELARTIARRKNARRATMIGSGCLALGIAIGWTTANKRGLPLPDMGTPVVVTTAGGSPHIAYLDLDNQWRNAETGERITNVTRWTTP